MEKMGRTAFYFEERRNKPIALASNMQKKKLEFYLLNYVSKSDKEIWKMMKIEWCFVFEWF